VNVAVDAAIFDLYGTLVPEFGKTAFFESVRAMAERLGADPAAFEQEWTHTGALRQTGGYPDGMIGNVRAICRTLGIEANEVALADALEPRAEMYRRRFHPRPGAVETLSELKRRGYATGLISMCAPDTPALWHASELAPFVDVTVFSSESGLRKPDAEIYHACTDALGVDPRRCVYVGDGSYRELTGAEAIGMTAYLIPDPDMDPADRLIPDADEWHERRIADLRELLEILPPPRR
jgi:putative hydrolase of the HAD superfamily